MGVGVFVGLDAVSLRQLVVLEQFWLGLVACRRLPAERMGFWQRSRPWGIRRQYRQPSVELSASDATGAWGGYAPSHSGRQCSPGAGHMAAPFA
jgi:hypothetical protein